MALFKKTPPKTKAPTNTETQSPAPVANETNETAATTTQTTKTVRARRQYVAVRETVEHVQIQTQQGDQTVSQIVVRTKRETIRYAEEVFVQQSVQAAVAPTVAAETNDTAPTESTQPETPKASKISKLVPKKIIPQAIQKFTEAKEKEHASPDAEQEVGIKKLLGLVMIETVDVFTDELLNIIKKHGMSQSTSWADKTKDSASRFQTELNARFEKRQIWQLAKAYKAENAIKDISKVMPDVLMKILLKMPTFVFAVAKESALSMGKCVSVLRSDDENKFAAISQILSETVVKVVTLYVQTIISTAITPIPLIGRFSDDISKVFVHMLKTLVPLLAVYAYEQSKNTVKAKLNLGAKTSK